MITTFCIIGYVFICYVGIKIAQAGSDQEDDE